MAKRLIVDSSDVLDQKIHPVVPYDDEMIGIRHSTQSNALPPTEGGYGHQLLERSIGSSAGGNRPVEDEIEGMGY